MIMSTTGLILLALGTTALVLTIACIIRRDLRKLEGVDGLVLAIRQANQEYTKARHWPSVEGWLRCDATMVHALHRANHVASTLPEED